MAVEKIYDFIIEHPSWIFIGLVTYTGVYLLSCLLGGRKQEENPFATDHRRPREPMITDPKDRDAILKEREHEF